MLAGWISVGAFAVWGIYDWWKEAARKCQNERKRQQEREDVLDGTIMPVAASLFAGTITPEEADRQIIQLNNWTDGVWFRWCGMTLDERLEIGRLTIELNANPTFRAKQES